MVQLLTATCPRLLSQHATGTFFEPGGYSYYGELPLSFAVCTNRADIVRVLLDARADLEARDIVNGNTAMHMTVLHGTMDMYVCGAHCLHRTPAA